MSVFEVIVGPNLRRKPLESPGKLLNVAESKRASSNLTSVLACQSWPAPVRSRNQVGVGWLTDRPASGHRTNQAPTKKLKLTRRHAFAVFGAGALALGLPAALAAEPAREGRSVGTMSVLKQDAVCVMSAEVTQGPYYISGQLVRQDITEGKQGFRSTSS